MAETPVTFKHIVRQFSGGILEDKRVQSQNHFSITKHFDTFTYPQKLVPYAQTITCNGLADGTPLASLNIIKFAWTPKAGGGYWLTGFGLDPSDNTKVQLFNLDLNSAADGSDANNLKWQAGANIFNGGTGYTGRNSNVFFYYKGSVYFFGASALQSLDPTNTIQGNSNVASISYSNVAQPVHHPLDDIAYFFADNVVYALNDTTWNGAVLTLPSNEIITCGAAFGNYLAIATVDSEGGIGCRSKVYLWDRDSSLTTVTDVVDFGEGLLRYIASLDGKLIGIVDYYTQSYFGLGKSKFIVKELSGEFGIPINEIISDTATSQSPNSLIVKDEKMYFPATLELDGDLRQGIWCVDSKGLMALDTIESAIIAGGNIDGIFNIGNVWFIAHSENGSVTHTDATGTYSAAVPSIYESLILSTVSVTPRGTIIMNASVTKKLIGALVTTEPLLAGQSVTLKYRYDSGLDDPSSWIIIFSNNVVGSTNHFALKLESNGANFENYNELQFRIESLGGAVVTGFEYSGEVIDNGLF